MNPGVAILLVVIAALGFSIIRSIGKSAGWWGATPKHVTAQKPPELWIHPSGEIYQGVQLYLTINHVPYGKIIGGDSHYVLVEKSDGKYRWFPRRMLYSDSTSFWIKSNDPAIRARRWKVIHIGEWPAEGP